MIFIDILTLIIIIGIISQILGLGKKKQPPQRQNRPQGQQRPPQQPQAPPAQKFKELLSEAQKNNRQDEAAKRARAAERRRIKELGKYAQPAPPLSEVQPQIKRAAEGQSLMMPSPPQEQFVPTQSVTAIQPLTVIKDSEGSVWQTRFEREDIVRGLVMAEILGKPKALKR